MPRRGPTTVDTRPSRHHQPPIRAHRGTTNRRSAPVGSTMRAAKHRILLHVPRACWTLARCGSMHVTIYHRMLDIGARRGSLHVPIYRDVAHAGHWRASWIIARPDISRRRACWTSARRGSLHVPIYRDVAHAGRWRVVDHCTSRYIATSRMLDIGASWINARILLNISGASCINFGACIGSRRANVQHARHQSPTSRSKRRAWWTLRVYIHYEIAPITRTRYRQNRRRACNRWPGRCG
jgi:hypothetical protein